jgi:hypothetical protein
MNFRDILVGGPHKVEYAKILKGNGNNQYTDKYGTPKDSGAAEGKAPNPPSRFPVAMEGKNLNPVGERITDRYKAALAGGAKDGSFSKAQVTSLKNYTSETDPPNYSDVNGMLRGKPGDYPETEPADVQKAVDALDAAMKVQSLGENAQLFRGLSGKTAAALYAKYKDNPNKAVGKAVTDKGFVSTTIDPKVADDWAVSWSTKGTAVILSIKAPKETHGVYVESISKSRGEKEFILPRDTKMSITGGTMKMNGGVSCLTLECVIDKA